MTSTTTRTCQWPNNSGATDFDNTVDPCGITDPSFDAHFDPTCDPLPVCDKHADKAKKAGHIITAAGMPCPLPAAQEIQEPGHWTPMYTRSVAALGDLELTVMSLCADALDTLKPDQQRRAATWLVERYVGEG